MFPLPCRFISKNGVTGHRPCGACAASASARRWTVCGSRGGPAAVHGVRKEIKKLRAVFRLVRGEISAGRLSQGGKALREAAIGWRAPRDARVMLKAFGKLAGRRWPGGFREFEKALQKNCRRETRRFRKDDSVAVAGQILRKSNRRVAGLKIKADGWTAIEPGLRQSYRRGRQAGKLAAPAAVAGKFSRVAEAGERFMASSPAALSGVAGGDACRDCRAGPARRTAR